MFSLAEADARNLADDICYGASIPNESELHLIGDLEGRRVLDLGCGAGHNAIRMALAGARVIAVDPDAANLRVARFAADAAEVTVEWHHGALADLAFLRADTVDVVLSAYGFVDVEDVSRLIRQIHRVLKEKSPLILSLPHPALGLVHPGLSDSLQIRGTWFDTFPTMAELFTLLTRNNYRVDVMVEPVASPDRPPAEGWNQLFRHVPPTMIVRARKQGL